VKVDTDRALSAPGAKDNLQRAFSDSPHHEDHADREAKRAWLALLDGVEEIEATPAALGYERALIGGLIKDQGALATAGDRVRPEMFATRPLGEVLAAMLEIETAGRKWSGTSLLEALAGRRPVPEEGWKALLVDCHRAVGAGVEADADAVSECWRNRKLAAIGAALYHRARGAKAHESSTLLDEVIQQTVELEPSTTRSRDQGIGELMKEVLAEARHRIETGNVRPGLATGWPRLDSMTGGLVPGCTTLLKAGTGVGKTAGALSIAKRCAEYCRGALNPDHQRLTVVFSLEMAAVHIASRVLSNDSEVDGMAIRQGNLSHDEISRLLDSVSRGAGLNDWLRVKYAPGAPISSIRRYLQLITKGGRKLGLVVIDYLQLITATGKHQSREQEVATISTGLVMLAKEFNCHVLALSQVNAEGEARESRRIEQDVDTVLKLEPENPEADPADMAYVYDLVVQKNRYGTTAAKGAYKLLFLKRYQRVVELAEGRQSTAWDR